jgi:CubicO group peptidase (beta-lactamase class C family)
LAGAVSRRFHRFLLLLSIALSLPTGCDYPTGPSEELKKPRKTGDGWQTASLSSVGMDPAPIQDLLQLIDDTEGHMIHSILIVRNQKLAFEQYWRGTDLVPEGLTPITKDFNRETPHWTASVSKSITSALAGIALDRGFIGSVDELLFSYYTEQQDLSTEEKASITLGHLLSFSSGYDWNEFVYGFGDPRDSHYQMFTSEDPIRYLLGRPLVTTPGAVFHYNSGDTNLLGEIVRMAAHAPTLADFAEEHLFGPLGIHDYEWQRIGSGSHLAFASGGVSLRPRDMAKFGAMYLGGGVWNGTRVLSRAWVEESTQMAVPLLGNYRTLYGYGYNWWLGRSQLGDRKVEYFRASGWGGQNIYVYPELDMVIVFTAGGFYEARPLNVNDLIEDYIFQAIVG